VALAIGVTAHEMTTLWRSGYPSIPVPVTPADHEAAIRSIFGPTYADRILAQYPASSYPSPALASVAATSDSSFVCVARELARAVARAQSEPVRRFYFSHVLASGPARSFGAGHGFDLLFSFAQYPLSFFMPNDSEKALSDAMIGYLTRFAATGDPNGAGAPAWPAYDPVEDTHLVFDDTITLGRKLREPQCDFWRSL
jgi:para-nitrobenzyl esterase